MAIAAIHSRHVAQIYGVSERESGSRSEVHGAFLLAKQGVAGIAIFCDGFAFRTDVLTVVTSETTVGIKVPDVVWMGLPIHLHLGKGSAAVNALDFIDRIADLELF